MNIPTHRRYTKCPIAKIIDVAEAWATDYSHESLANKLAIQYHYYSEQMEFETPRGDDGEPDHSRVRIVVYSK